MRKIVITGANGFTGSHVLESFEQSTIPNLSVIAACRTESKLPNWYRGPKLTGDLSDKSYVTRLTREADVICHTAAWAEMNGSQQDSDKFFYEPTVDLINKAHKNGVKRFIFLSSTTANPVSENRLHSNQTLHKIWPHFHNVIRIEDLLRTLSNKGMEVVILRAGLFTGKNYSLGLLPILLPRLKTHLVPWVNKGMTSLPLVNGADIGHAFKLASLANLKKNYNLFDVAGKEVPTVREVLTYLHEQYNYPLPHFNVSFKFAYAFARFVRLLHKVLPGDPLIVPAIVLLLEETNVSNQSANKVLGYEPTIHWKESIDIQISEMNTRQTSNMKMNKVS